MALARPMHEIARRHRDLDARYGGKPGLLSAAHKPSDRSGLAAGALGGSDQLSTGACSDAIRSSLSCPAEATTRILAPGAIAWADWMSSAISTAHPVRSAAEESTGMPSG